MRVDPEELVELRNHGPMKLRCAVARAMVLLPTERRKATIVRRSEPTVLNFKTIKDLLNVFERSRRPKPRSASKRSKSHPLSRSRGKTSSRLESCLDYSCPQAKNWRCASPAKTKRYAHRPIWPAASVWSQSA